jgi:hypothetical protein
MHVSQPTLTAPSGAGASWADRCFIANASPSFRTGAHDALSFVDLEQSQAVKERAKEFGKLENLELKVGAMCDRAAMLSDSSCASIRSSMGSLSPSGHSGGMLPIG